MDIKDILTLSDGNEYVIVSKITYENKIYLYLVDINNHNNIKICYLDNNEIVIVKDNNLIIKIMPLLLKELKNNFKFK